MLSKLFSFVGKTAKLRLFIGLFLVGAIFLTVSIIMIANPQETVECEATITERYSRLEPTAADDTETEYAKVRYTVDGTEYQAEVPCSSFDNVGETMEIAYHPDNPGEPFSAGVEWMQYLFLALGAILVLIPIVKLVFTLVVYFRH